MDQRAKQPRFNALQLGDQIGAALSPVNPLVDAEENLFDLLVEFAAIGDDEHTRVLHMLAYPFSEPDHDQALARPLSVPDDATLAAPDVLLGCAHREILVVPAEFLCSCVEQNEVVDQFEYRSFSQSCVSPRSSGFSMSLFSFQVR